MDTSKTVAVTTSSFTAPADGIITGLCYSYSDYKIYIDNVLVFHSKSNSPAWCHLAYPLAKGSTISGLSGQDDRNYGVYFTPWK